MASANADIEDVLSHLELVVDAAKTLTDDSLFVRDVLNNNQQKMKAHIAWKREMREEIYRRVIDQYSQVDSQKAASLYRGLLAELPIWFPELTGFGATIPVFTLNYDPAVELALSVLRGEKPRYDRQKPVRLVDGLVEVSGATERRWSADAFVHYRESPDETTVVLVKLHGSVRWGYRALRSQANGRVIIELPVGVGRNPGEIEHAVLYPTRNVKTIDEEPFRTGFSCFRACLEAASVIIVIGCSLHDPEVNAVIREGLGENSNLKVIIVGSTKLDHYQVAQRLSMDASKIAVIRERFRLPELPPEQNPTGFDQLLSCLRLLVYAACGAGTANPAAKFGMTYVYGARGTFPLCPVDVTP
jgi:hypothetical protein